jgi:hypothetical protein
MDWKDLEAKHSLYTKAVSTHEWAVRMGKIPRKAV